MIPVGRRAQTTSNSEENSLPPLQWTKPSPFPPSCALSAEVLIPKCLIKPRNNEDNDSDFLPTIVSLPRYGEIFLEMLPEEGFL